MASGDRVETRLVGPVALGATAATAIGSAVGAGKAWVVKQVIICNTDGTDRLVNVALNTTATVGNRLFWTLPIAAGDTIIWDTALVMNAGDQFYAHADTGSVVTFTAVGWEKTL